MTMTRHEMLLDACEVLLESAEEDDDGRSTVATAHLLNLRILVAMLREQEPGDTADAFRPRDA